MLLCIRITPGSFDLCYLSVCGTDEETLLIRSLIVSVSTLTNSNPEFIGNLKRATLSEISPVKPYPINAPYHFIKHFTFMM